MYKIAHISDTHIRNLKYHDDYRAVFKQLYQTLRKEQPDYIVHCGDLAHTKTQLSPEYFDLASEFLDNLGNIAPLIIILGNHDGNLKNESREDAVSPIVKALNNPNITLLKDSGEYSPVKGLNFNVLSVFDRDNWIKPSTPSDINIALYHGSISGCLTASGWAMDLGDDTGSIFKDHDYAMLGDIHRPQALDRERRVWYCGSTIQQNFAEDPRKGLLVWEIEDKDKFSVRKVNLVNPRPFITVHLDNGKLPDIHVPRNARLRLISRKSIDVHRLRKACDMARSRWSPHSVTFLNRNESEALTSKQTYSNTVQENLRDISIQEKYIREYLKDYELEDEVMDEVLNYNKKYNQKAEEAEEVSRNVVWKIKKLKWNNFFNYGEENEINFDKLQGLVGIFGKNYSGKSSIIDAALYSLFNATAKSERRNVHVINQNRDKASGLIQIEAGGEVYQIARNLTKYDKRLKGKVTKEAKVELDFTRISDMEPLNGTTRNETDKNIRKKFGSIDDFFLTSMASQMEPLSFIKEGSTKRKEILAKFLDLEFFDRKFKLAKKDAAELRGVVKRMEGRDWASEIRKKRDILQEICEEIEVERASCENLNRFIERNKTELRVIEDSIAQIPAEVIDIDEVKADLRDKAFKIRDMLATNVSHADNKAKLSEELSRLKDELHRSPNIMGLEKQKAYHHELTQKRIKQSGVLKAAKLKLKNIQKKIKLLDEHEYDPDCQYCVSNKFVKDAHKAKSSMEQVQTSMDSAQSSLTETETMISVIAIEEIEKAIKNHHLLVKKVDQCESNIVNNDHVIRNNLSKIKLFETEVGILEDKEKLYNDNKDAIENLETLKREKVAIEKVLRKKASALTKCNKTMHDLYVEQGSTKQTIETLLEKQKELDAVQREWVAYDLFMQCMHPNGIPYVVIKNKLPLLNEEVSKILANIVDFEVFFENNDKKLDINIKHPYYDPRPLSMGSGAEKTLASMAIRLALISITNLPKSELFILDEPATALDHEHMEGFIRLLQMIKSQFKTVILISHLDSLKDVVDMTIDIDKVDGYAKVRI